MATSYDELWTTFVDSSGIDVATLPQSDRYIYALINKAVDLYNEKIDEEFYDALEIVNDVSSYEIDWVESSKILLQILHFHQSYI